MLDMKALTGAMQGMGQLQATLASLDAGIARIGDLLVEQNALLAMDRIPRHSWSEDDEPLMEWLHEIAGRATLPEGD
jgi:hypothetical protein